MARTNKIGIDYFPLNVDFFQDDKIQLIEAEFGVKGGYIAIRLLCKIYREGYFYRWGADECLLFAKNISTEGISKGIVEEVVKGLVKRGFFNEAVFDTFGILTSAGIQRRYFEATKRYKIVEAIGEYLLVDASEFEHVHIIPINVDINKKNADTNQQRKGKEKRVKENSKREAAIAATLAREKEFYDTLVPYVEKYGKEMIRKFFNHWTEKNKLQTKMRFEQQTTWETAKRLATWAGRENDFKPRQASEDPPKKPLKVL
jgi:hypothetical protein